MNQIPGDQKNLQRQIQKILWYPFCIIQFLESQRWKMWWYCSILNHFQRANPKFFVISLLLIPLLIFLEMRMPNMFELKTFRQCILYGIRLLKFRRCFLSEKSIFQKVGTFHEYFEPYGRSWLGLLQACYCVHAVSDRSVSSLLRGSVVNR